jgi:hypothetical protein
VAYKGVKGKSDTSENVRINGITYKSATVAASYAKNPPQDLSLPRPTGKGHDNEGQQPPGHFLTLHAYLPSWPQMRGTPHTPRNTYAMVLRTRPSPTPTPKKQGKTPKRTPNKGRDKTYRMVRQTKKTRKSATSPLTHSLPSEFSNVADSLPTSESATPIEDQQMDVEDTTEQSLESLLSTLFDGQLTDLSDDEEDRTARIPMSVDSLKATTWLATLPNDFDDPDLALPSGLVQRWRRVSSPSVTSGATVTGITTSGGTAMATPEILMADGDGWETQSNISMMSVGTSLTMGTVSMRSVSSRSDATMRTWSTTRTIRVGLGAVNMEPIVEDDRMSVVSDATVRASVIPAGMRLPVGDVEDTLMAGNEEAEARSITPIVPPAVEATEPQLRRSPRKRVKRF